MLEFDLQWHDLKLEKYEFQLLIGINFQKGEFALQKNEFALQKGLPILFLEICEFAR